MRILLLALSFLAIISCSNQTENTTIERPHSGAFEALSMFGEARSYPSNKIPNGAYLAAWEHAQLLPSASPSRSDSWSSIGPHNRAGRMLAIAFNPQNSNTMFAGSASGGLWKSYTGGTGKNAWERVTTGYPVLGVSSITFNPDDSMTLYIGTGEVYNHLAAGTGAAYRNTRGSYGIGVLKSEDGGLTWAKSLDFDYDDQGGVWDVQMCASSPDVVYAATTEGVYKSSNAGDDWTLVFEIDMVTDILVHEDDPDLVIAGCGNFGSPNHGIHISQDGGSTWSKITSEIPDLFYGKVQLSASKSSPDLVFASIGNGFGFDDGASWLCKSEDFGATWEVINTTDYSLWQGWFAHDVDIHPTTPNRLAVIGIEVWTSSNGGNSIAVKSVGGIGYDNPPIEGPDGGSNHVHSDCHDVVWHPDLINTFYVASDGGIHRTDDGGESFYSCNGRLQTTQFYNGISISAQDSLNVLGGMQDNGTSRLNDDIDPETGQYLTWELQFGGDGSWTAINQEFDYIHYVSYQFLNVQIFNGVSFDPLYIPKIEPTGFIAPYVAFAGDGNYMYAGSAGVARSDDGGVNWDMTNGGEPLDGHPTLSMSMSSTDPLVVYTATSPDNSGPGGVFVTQDGGDNWTNVTGDLPDRYPMDIQVDPINDAIAYITFSGFGTGHLFRTTDYGNSWEDITGDLPDVPTNAVAIDPEDTKVIYVGNDLGIYVSNDSGETWAVFMDGLPEALMVFDLKIQDDSRKLYAASHGNGAWWTDLIENEEPPVSIEEINSDIRVYPTITSNEIAIDLKHASGNITVRIINMNEQTVITKTLAASATQVILLNELSTGNYLVEIRQGKERFVEQIFKY